MKKFVIVTDSCSDLEKERREKYGIDYIPMHITCEGKEYVADLDFNEIPYKEYFNMLRNGKVFKTSQVTESQYREAFEKYVLDGFDILSISCSSGLSNSYNESCKVRDEFKEKYPETKIVCVDSLNSCNGLGLLCVTASDMRAQGKSIEEIGEWLEKHKLKMNQECTVEKLTYLKNAGRVSATSAFFGGIFNVKPIIISDALGHNNAVEKVKGRKASIERIAERVKAQYEKTPYQRIFFGHADCEEDMELLKSAVFKEIDADGVPVETGRIGPIIGASAGPGTIAVYFYGKEVTYGK